jgi:hypothetical protein
MTDETTPGRYSTPFANGFEVDWFRANRCDQCVLDHPDGGGCDEFALGVVVEGGWATDGRLVPVDRSPANPLGVECTRYRCHDDADLVPGTGAYCGTCGTYASGPTDRDDPDPTDDPPTKEAPRG